MASSTALPQSATTTPSAAPAPATSPQDFILKYMEDTQVDAARDDTPRAPNAYTIFKKYYQLPPTAASANVWKNLGTYERGLFYDAEDAAKALHRKMYPDYKFQPKSKGGPRGKRSHALGASVIPVNSSAPSTFIAPAPSFFVPEHPMQDDYHAHHYGYTDHISDLANDLFDSYEIVEVTGYLVEHFENMLADVKSGICVARTS